MATASKSSEQLREPEWRIRWQRKSTRNIAARLRWWFAASRPGDSSLDRNFILFTTDLFVYDQSDSDIDRWFVGGDCCGWFYMRLLLLDNVELGFPPVMEDWGWTFAVTANDIPVTINTWSYEEIPKCWVMGLYVRERRFFKHPEEKRNMARDIVADGIESIIRNDDRFDRRCWMNDNPFDTGVKAFPE